MNTRANTRVCPYADTTSSTRADNAARADTQVCPYTKDHIEHTGRHTGLPLHENHIEHTGRHAGLPLQNANSWYKGR
ncbi:MAG: hypothetical protein ACM3SY_18830 [Candidatus Omnitrophota bacterium]